MENYTPMFRFFIALIALILVACGDSDSTKTIALADVLPPKSIVVLQFESLEALQKDLNTNRFIKENSEQALFKELQQQLNVLQQINTNLSGMLSISSIGSDRFAYTFVTNSSESLIKTGLITAEKQLDYDGTSLLELNINDQTFYSTKLNNVSLISTSLLSLENTIRSFRNNISLEPSFYKALKASSNSKHSLFIKLSSLRKIHSSLFTSKASIYESLGEWSVIDLDIKPEEIWGNGVILNSDAQQSLIEILGKDKTDSNNFAEAIPLNTAYFVNFSILDFASFQDRRRNLGYASEIISHPIEDFPASISLAYGTNNQVCLDYMPENVLGFEEVFLSDLKQEESFRGEQIYTLENFDAFEHFSPLIQDFLPKYVTKYKGHFLFSEALETIENTLVNIKNNATLSQTDYFEESSDALKSGYTLQIGSLNENLKSTLTNISQPEISTYWNQIKLSGFSLALLQLDQQEQYTLVNTYTKSAVNSPKANLKVNRIKRDHTIASRPYYFVNWRTQQHDIVYQDENNVLHLIDSKGREIWKRALDSKIVGEIKSLDIYKNTRLQLAFVTQNKFYVIDKNGNDVSRFPINIKDTVTQELQIFDYANSGRYRFVITQGNKIEMYDVDGKIVKGFEFKASQLNLTQAPKHIRIGTKDYILAQTNAELYILSRTGDIRVNLDTDFNPSDNSFYRYGDQFIGSSNRSELATISTSGKVNLSPQNWFKTHFFTANEKDYVALSENKLQINTEEINLNYGLYKRPQIHQLTSDEFISLVDEQTQQVYLFNTKGELVEGFPIYGSASIEVREIEPGKYEFITQGNEASILVYSFTN